MKIVKFIKAASSANDADEAYYVPGSEVRFMETAATSVVLHILGRGADNVSDDTITITCGAGDEFAIADKLGSMLYGNVTSSDLIEVGVGFYPGITTIAYAVA